MAIPHLRGGHFDMLGPAATVAAAILELAGVQHSP
jgi:hypothetical protein